MVDHATTDPLSEVLADIPPAIIDGKRFTLRMFFGLSAWAERWFTTWGIERGINPRTLQPEEHRFVPDEESLTDLGRYGPMFSAAFEDYATELSSIAAVVGPVKTRLGFINDPQGWGMGNRTSIRCETFESAHAALSHWIDQYGHLFFSDWFTAKHQSAYFDGDYFSQEPPADFAADVSDPIRKSDLQYEWRRERKRESEQFVMRQIDRVCWDERGLAHIIARFNQERCSLMVMPESPNICRDQLLRGDDGTFGKPIKNGPPSETVDLSPKQLRTIFDIEDQETLLNRISSGVIVATMINTKKYSVEVSSLPPDWRTRLNNALGKV